MRQKSRALLRSADILCYLENEHTLAKVWAWNVAQGGLRLMVPASLAGQIQMILGDMPSEEDLPSSATSESPPLDLSDEPTAFGVLSRGRVGLCARTVLAVAVLCAPSLETLRLLNVG
jgi:hypothetical protein